MRRAARFAAVTPLVPVARALAAAVALALCAPVWAAAPAKAAPSRLYLANDEHTDYMWSTDEGGYGAIFVDLLDYHLKLADQTAKLAPPYRNRFNTDGSLWLWEYEKRKGPAAFRRLMARIKDGSISSPLNTLVSAGYKSYEIVAGPGTRQWPQAAGYDSGVFGNGRVQLRVARDGAITGYRDWSNGGAELAAMINGRALNDLAPQPRSAALGLAGGMAGAWQTSHIETDRTRLPVTGGKVRGAFTQQQIQTFRLLPAGK